MQLSQAIVSSGIASANQSNKLIAWSHDINEATAQEICLWCPRPDQFAPGCSTSLNVFATNATQTAITRSILVRAGSKLSVQTRVVIANQTELGGYHHNLMSLARVLESNGDLSILDGGSSELPVLQIPDSSIPDVRRTLAETHAAYPAKIEHALDIHKQCVVLGLENPKAFASGFLTTLDEAKRTQFSFTTGLNVSENSSLTPQHKRSFDLHFLSESTPTMDADLARLQIRTITVL